MIGDAAILTHDLPSWEFTSWYATKNGGFCTLKIWVTTPENEGTLGLYGVYPPGSLANIPYQARHF